MAMMGVKTGTKTFADTRHDGAVKTDNSHRNSAHDLKQLGQADVGELLNQISDPNWVDPSKRVRAIGSDKLDKDAFMKLMLTQMKNQDPTNPLKSHEMAAQLAQFSSLEQLQNLNTSLEEIKNGQKPQETYQALNFIGKKVAGDSAKLVRAKGDRSHRFSFELGEDVKNVTIELKNAEGEKVRSVALTDLKKGANEWTWNGEGENGLQASSGEYNLVIEAKNALGKKIAVKTDFDGIITGVNYTPEGPVLLVGDQSVKLKDVKKIVDPGYEKPSGAGQKNDQKIEKSTSPQLQTAESAADNKNKGAPDKSDMPKGNIMTGVAMTTDMMDKLKKETTGQ